MTALINDHAVAPPSTRAVEPNRSEHLADHLAHNAATAIVCSGLKRQIQHLQISLEQIVDVFDAMFEESTAAHSFAAEVLSVDQPSHL